MRKPEKSSSKITNRPGKTTNDPALAGQAHLPKCELKALYGKLRTLVPIDFER
jgi:hypothetical protein